MKKHDLNKVITIFSAILVIVAGLIFIPFPGTNVEAAGANSKISADKAKKIALTDAKAKESKVKKLKVEKDGKVYEVEFIKGDFKYEYDIFCSNGKIKSLEKTRVSLSASDKDKKVSKKKAKNIALKAAGVKESDVSDLEVKSKKTKKGFIYYDVEFNIGRTEYEYEIDGYTGIILEYEIES